MIDYLRDHSSPISIILKYFLTVGTDNPVRRALSDVAHVPRRGAET